MWLQKWNTRVPSCKIFSCCKVKQNGPPLYKFSFFHHPTQGFPLVFIFIHKHVYFWRTMKKWKLLQGGTLMIFDQCRYGYPPSFLQKVVEGGSSVGSSSDSKNHRLTKTLKLESKEQFIQIQNCWYLTSSIFIKKRDVKWKVDA